MNDDATFRPVLIAGFVLIVVVTGYHRAKSATREPLDRRQEGTFILATLRPVAALLWFGVFAYMINPAWMAWSSVALPQTVRWSGAVLCVITAGFLFWTLHSLGKNLTDTVVTRKSHTMITHGPYRYVRNPFYDSMLLIVVSISLITANWFLLLTGVMSFALLAIRTRTEEQHLIARFGDEYRNYMKGTGRFLPKFGS